MMYDSPEGQTHSYCNCETPTPGEVMPDTCIVCLNPIFRIGEAECA